MSPKFHFFSLSDSLCNLSLIILLLFLFFFIPGCNGGGGGGGDDDGDDNIPTVNVSGYVQDINEDSVSGAKVTITSDPVIVYSDSEGYFSVNLEVGEHNINIQIGALTVYSSTFTCNEESDYSLGDIVTTYDPESAGIDNDGDGFSENEGDCNDSDVNIFPGATELCSDGIDNDCDGYTDCQDSDCDANPVCDVVDPGDITLQWLVRTELSTQFEYSGGTIVKMIFYRNILIAGGSGMVRLVASMKEYEGLNTLDEQTAAFDVQANQTYEVIVEVDVSNWGSCNPSYTNSMVFSSPAASATSQIDLYSFSDLDTNWYKCAGSYTISDIRIQPYGSASGSPVVGGWIGTSGFGQIEFQVTSDGAAIEEVNLIFMDFSCGNIVSGSGYIMFSNSPGWPITDGEFSIDLTLSHTLDQEMQLQGTFTDAGTTVTGTFTADFNDTVCQGTFDAAPATE